MLTHTYVDGRLQVCLHLHTTGRAHTYAHLHVYLRLHVHRARLCVAHVFAYTCAWRTHVHAHTYVRSRTVLLLRMPGHARTRLHVHGHAPARLLTYVCLRAHTYVRGHVCARVFAQICGQASDTPGRRVALAGGGGCPTFGGAIKAILGHWES